MDIHGDIFLSLLSFLSFLSFLASLMIIHSEGRDTGALALVAGRWLL